MLAFNRDLVAVEQFDDTGRRAGAGRGDSGDEAADVIRMKAVDVLIGPYAVQNAAAIDLLRQWHLDQDAIDFAALIQAFDDAEEVLAREVLGRRDLLAVKAEGFAGFHLGAYVDFGSRVVPDEDDGEAGSALQPRDAGLQFGQDLVAHPFAVKDFGAHSLVRITLGQWRILPGGPGHFHAALFRAISSRIMRRRVSSHRGSLPQRIPW